MEKITVFSVSFRAISIPDVDKRSGEPRLFRLVVGRVNRARACRSSVYSLSTRTHERATPGNGVERE